MSYFVWIALLPFLAQANIWADLDYSSQAEECVILNFETGEEYPCYIENICEAEGECDGGQTTGEWHFNEETSSWDFQTEPYDEEDLSYSSENDVWLHPEGLEDEYFSDEEDDFDWLGPYDYEYNEDEEEEEGPESEYFSDEEEEEDWLAGYAYSFITEEEEEGEGPENEYFTEEEDEEDWLGSLEYDEGLEYDEEVEHEEEGDDEEEGDNEDDHFIFNEDEDYPDYLSEEEEKTPERLLGDLKKQFNRLLEKGYIRRTKKIESLLDGAFDHIFVGELQTFSTAEDGHCFTQEVEMFSEDPYYDVIMEPDYCELYSERASYYVIPCDDIILEEDLCESFSTDSYYTTEVDLCTDFSPDNFYPCATLYPLPQEEEIVVPESQRNRAELYYNRNRAELYGKYLPGKNLAAQVSRTEEEEVKKLIFPIRGVNYVVESVENIEIRDLNDDELYEEDEENMWEDGRWDWDEDDSLIELVDDDYL